MEDQAFDSPDVSSVSQDPRPESISQKKNTTENRTQDPGLKSISQEEGGLYNTSKASPQGLDPVAQRQKKAPEEGEKGSSPPSTSHILQKRRGEIQKATKGFFAFLTGKPPSSKPNPKEVPFLKPLVPKKEKPPEGQSPPSTSHILQKRRGEIQKATKGFFAFLTGKPPPTKPSASKEAPQKKEVEIIKRIPSKPLGLKKESLPIPSAVPGNLTVKKGDKKDSHENLETPQHQHLDQIVQKIPNPSDAGLPDHKNSTEVHQGEGEKGFSHKSLTSLCESYPPFQGFIRSKYNNAPTLHQKLPVTLYFEVLPPKDFLLNFQSALKHWNSLWNEYKKFYKVQDRTPLFELTENEGIVRVVFNHRVKVAEVVSTVLYTGKDLARITSSTFEINSLLPWYADPSYDNQIERIQSLPLEEKFKVSQHRTSLFPRITIQLNRMPPKTLKNPFKRHPARHPSSTGEVPLGQMDFSTVVLHELGHVAGLDHQSRLWDEEGKKFYDLILSDPDYSIMVPTTSRGATRRSIGIKDLRHLLCGYHYDSKLRHGLLRF